MCFPFPIILHQFSAYLYLHGTSLRPGFTHFPIYVLSWLMKCLLVTFSSHLPFMVGTISTFSQRFHDKIIICYIPLGASHLIFINTWLMKNTTLSFPVWQYFYREISQKRHREWKYFFVTRSKGEHNHRNLIGNGWKYQNHKNAKEWDEGVYGKAW